MDSLDEFKALRTLKPNQADYSRENINMELIYFGNLLFKIGRFTLRFFLSIKFGVITAVYAHPQYKPTCRW